MHKPLSPSGIHPPFAPYSHGIEIVSRSRLVFCSGQLGISAEAEVPSDCAGQARLCFDNIRAILAESLYRGSVVQRAGAASPWASQVRAGS